MQCPHCKSENSENAKFCPRCGKNMFDAPLAATLDSAYVPEIPKVNVSLSARTKLIFVAIAIVILSVVAYQLITKPLTPNQVATKFMDSMQKGNWSKAYSYLDESSFIGREYLSEDCFKAAFANSKVSEYKLDTATKSAVVQTSFHYVLSNGGERNEGNLNLVNHPEGKKDNWKIDPSNFMINSEIRTRPEVTVKINEKPVKIETGSVVIPMFKGYTFQVSMENPDIKPLKIDSQAGKRVDGTTLETSPALQETVKNQINGYNKASIQTVKDFNMSPCGNFVKQGSEEWRRWESYLRNLQSSQSTEELVLKDIKISNVRFAGSLKMVYADCDEVWDKTYKNSSGEITGQENDHLIKWSYNLEKQENGTWLITRVSHRY